MAGRKAAHTRPVVGATPARPITRSDSRQQESPEDKVKRARLRIERGEKVGEVLADEELEPSTYFR